MSVEKLKKYDLIYLATPYSKYPDGMEAAFIEACKLTAKLMLEDITVYSPIAHTHPIAEYGNIDKSHNFNWLKFDEVILARCDAIVAATMASWEVSVGLMHELNFFKGPKYLINPNTLCVIPAHLSPQLSHQQSLRTQLQCDLLEISDVQSELPSDATTQSG